MTQLASAPVYTQGFGSQPQNTPVIATVSPNSTNIHYPIGTRWINTAIGAEYVLVDLVTSLGVTTATWAAAAGGSVELSTLTGDTGTAVPSAGNIKIAGTTDEITTAASGSTVTLTIPSTFIAPGSIASTTTIASGTTLTAGTGLTVTTGGATITAGGLTVTAGGAGITGTTNINTTGASVTTIGTGGTGAVDIGNATGNTSVTGSLTASTTLTATLGTATNGNLVAATSGTGLLFTPVTGSGAASGAVTCSGRVGSVSFTSPSIAGGADITVTMTNTSITGSGTIILYSLRGATLGAALNIVSVTNSANSSAVVISNGTGATTQTSTITLDFIVLN